MPVFHFLFILFFTEQVLGCIYSKTPQQFQLVQLAGQYMIVAKLQALVYDILPSTTAVFSYAIGSRKLSANEQFFCWCSNSS